jgi:hypothetical protein
MPTLSAAVLLQIWEQCQRLHPADRAIRLLSARYPDLPPAELAELSLGQRDARLLDLRQETFGCELDSMADCPHCGERVEFALSTVDLKADQPPSSVANLADRDGRQLRFRPLNSYDLAAVATADTPEAGRRLLAQRCLTDSGGVELSEELVTQLAAALAAMDPQAEILLDLTCPACSCTWQLSFDIAAYLWGEISAEALRLLREVDMLARTYGWREADILAMSAVRRQAYIGMSA